MRSICCTAALPFPLFLPRISLNGAGKRSFSCIAALPSYLGSLVPEDEKQGCHALLIGLSCLPMPARLQYCVYVLLSMHDGDLYVGFTTDLKRRLTEHFHGQSKATAPRRPFRLIYCEYFFSKEDAERREGYLKTTAGRKGLKLILRETLKSRVWD
jgi:putative endonuclease